MMIRWVGLFIVMASWSMPSLANSDCVVVVPDVPSLLRDADLVFTGTLVKADYQERLTFRADRIWKGRPASRDIVVYVLGAPYIGSYVFQEGQRHLMFTRALSANDRLAAGVRPGEPIALGIARSCGGPPWPLKLSAELDKMTRTRKPRG